MKAMTGDQLEALERERARLETLLESDSNWRMRAELSTAQGQERYAGIVDHADLKRSLETVLSTNRYYLAHRKIVEAIAILREAAAHAAAARPDTPRADLPRPPPPEIAAAITRAQRSGIADRMVLLQAPASAQDGFRTKLKVKEAGAHEPAPADAATLKGADADLLAGDELTLIRGIDRARAASLNGMGTMTFAQIAAWTGADVAQVSESLGLGRAITRQGWIEQAALLAQRRDGGGVVYRPAPVPVAAARPDGNAHAVATAMPAPVPAAATAPIAASEAPPPIPDRIDLIRGVDAAMATRLAEAGVRRFAEIAAWTRADLARLRAKIGPGVAPPREGWIEQAALLATGRDTAHALRAKRGLILPLAPAPSPDAGVPRDLLTDWLVTPAMTVFEQVAEPVPALDARDAIATVDERPAAAEFADPDPADDADVPVVLEPVATALVVPEPDRTEPVRVEPMLETLARTAAAAGDSESSANFVAPAVVAPPAPSPPREETMAERLARLEIELADLDGGNSRPFPDVPPHNTSAQAPVTSASRPLSPPGVPPAGVVGHERLPRNIEDEEFPQLHVGEADVVIMPRAPRTLPDLPRPAARLKPQLEDPIDGETYAAYQSQIEEASVEIVRREPVAVPAEADARAEDTHEARTPGMRRFLKALKGD